MDNKIKLTETAEVLKEVVSVLDKLSINYFLTGSLASGVRGEFRATNDIDIVVEIDTKDVAKFVDLVSKTFFADTIHIQNAVATKRSFNIIHIETVIKVDLFTNIGPLQTEQLRRATSIAVPGVNQSVKIATAEDIIISKLIWYEKGGRSSERQWRDIHGVITVTGAALDKNYILNWSQKLGIAELAKMILGT